MFATLSVLPSRTVTYGYSERDIISAVSLDLTRLRERLRAERKLRWKNNRLAHKASGIGASTIAKIENLKTYPDYDPGVGLLSKYLEAMGLTLHDVVTQISGSLSSDSQGHLKSDRKSLRSSKASGKTALQSQPRGAHGESSAVSHDELEQLRHEIAQLRAASVEAGAILIGSGSGGRKLDPPSDQTTTGRSRSGRPRPR